MVILFRQLREISGPIAEEILVGMPTVPVYGYGRKVYGWWTGTVHPYPYRQCLFITARRYGTAYGTAVKRLYGTYGLNQRNMATIRG